MEPIIQEILDGIDTKIAQLQAAKRAILGSVNHAREIAPFNPLPKPARPIVIPKKGSSPQKRSMSTEVRKRIAEAQKARWAEKRKQNVKK